MRLFIQFFLTMRGVYENTNISEFIFIASPYGSRLRGFGVYRFTN